MSYRSQRRLTKVFDALIARSAWWLPVSFAIVAIIALFKPVDNDLLQAILAAAVIVAATAGGVWMLAGLGRDIAALPKPRPRFSLRTLLIATMLVAVVLGVIVWASAH